MSSPIRTANLWHTTVGKIVGVAKRAGAALVIRRADSGAKPLIFRHGRDLFEIRGAKARPRFIDAIDRP
jgi:hypothetical protein